jgi:hypothetical protein
VNLIAKWKSFKKRNNVGFQDVWNKEQPFSVNPKKEYFILGG